MIFKGGKKAVISKGDFHPAQFYKGDKKISGYSLEEFQGTDNATLENCYNDKIYDVQINSKNLLDVKKVYPDLVNEENGITFTRQNLDTLFSKNICSKYKEKTAYTFSCDYDITVNNNSVYPYVVYTDGTKQGFYSYMVSGTGNFSGHCKITTDSNKTVKTITFGYTTSTRDYNGIFTNMQLEEGRKETEYEQPCRNATITARGENVLDVKTIIPFENGNLMADIPTFKGTTVLEIESDIVTTISGKYKRTEV